jgi:hypothetical protein
MLFYCALNLSRLASGLGQEIATQLFKVRDVMRVRVVAGVYFTFKATCKHYHNLLHFCTFTIDSA